VFEVVANELEFLRNIDWEAGERVRKDLVRRGPLRSSLKAAVNLFPYTIYTHNLERCGMLWTDLQARPWSFLKIP
jgi:hypothetical protein